VQLGHRARDLRANLHGRTGLSVPVAVTVLETLPRWTTGGLVVSAPDFLAYLKKMSAAATTTTTTIRMVRDRLRTLADLRHLMRIGVPGTGQGR
jgi:hypothetical protein